MKENAVRKPRGNQQTIVEKAKLHYAGANCQSILNRARAGIPRRHRQGETIAQKTITWEVSFGN